MRVLIFGATGTAGKGVLRAVLACKQVSEVRAIVRRDIQPAIDNEKLKVYKHDNFLDYSANQAAFQNIDATFFCLGLVPELFPDEKQYREVTYDYALAAAKTAHDQSPNATFVYLSGSAVSKDSMLFAVRAKAETEEALMTQYQANVARPGAIDGGPDPTARLPRRILSPLLSLLSWSTIMYITAEELGLAMIQSVLLHCRSKIFTNAEMREMAAALKAQNGES